MSYNYKEFETEKKPISRCALCGRIIDYCTRDNPCPNCKGTFFTVEYKDEEKI